MRVMRTMWTTFTRNKEAPPGRRVASQVGRTGSVLRALETEDRALRNCSGRDGPPHQKNRAAVFAPLFGAPRSKCAFTLFELVVVLSIIVILATMGLIGYQAAVPPGAVNAARNELHGLLRFAREQAIVRGSNSMLIINYDSTDRAKFLRYAGVIVEEELGSGNWLAAHSGIYLPKGVYFVPESEGDPVIDGFSFESTWPLDTADPDMRSEYLCSISNTANSIGAIEYPVTQAVALDASTGNIQDWIGYQFGPDGHAKKADFANCSGGGGIVWNHIVLGLASTQADGSLLFEGSDKTVGIVIRANGMSFAIDDSNAL